MTMYHEMIRIPVRIDCPEPMRAAVRYVLEGEYESHCDGEGLHILDIGANVGSFAIWALHRWPGSRVTCFEPNPGTFAFLARNTGGHAAVTRHNAAVFPGLGARSAFFSRYDGDGEAGLMAYAGDTFRPETMADVIEVAVTDPRALPSADVVKLDVEGGEGEILAALDLSGTSLVLAEFQNLRNRDRIRDVLAAEFDPILDEACPWDPILDYQGYRADLAGDSYGRIFYARRGMTRMSLRPGG
jgi:FkbM family methyltransferase